LQGGPVIDTEGQVVGIAFQGNDKVGEFIPNCVFERFLQLPEHADAGEILSVPGLSFSWQALENKAMLAAVGLSELEGNNKSGIYVTSVAPFGSIFSVLKTGDVIVEVEGLNIGNFGTILFSSFRIGFSHLFTSRAIGDTIHVGIVREGRRHNIQWTLNSAESGKLVPKYDRMKVKGADPDYLVIGGIVFVSLSEQTIEALDDMCRTSQMIHLADLLQYGRKSTLDQECVVVGKVLPNEVASGYHGIQGSLVCAFNGIETRSLAHLAELYEGCKDEYIQINLDCRNDPSLSCVIFKQETVLEAEEEIFENYRIPARSRIDGKDLSEDDEPEAMVSMDEQGHMHVHLVCQRCGFTPNIETSDIEQEQD
jgi:hypothetical protein